MNWLVGGPPGLAYQREREVLKRRHDSTPPGSWLRQKYEEHRRAYPVVEDAFALPSAAFAFPVATRDQLLRRLDAMLGREGVLDGLTPPVSDYAPAMAREMYDDGA